LGTSTTDIALYERIRRMREDFDRMLNELAEAGNQAPESQVTSLVPEAVEASRRKVRAARAAPESQTTQALIRPLCNCSLNLRCTVH
jgi:hypothetical protein